MNSLNMTRKQPSFNLDISRQSLNKAYPTLIMYDKISFFLRKYFKSGKISIYEIYSYLEILEPKIMEILSYEDFFYIFDIVDKSFTPYCEQYFLNDGNDVLGEIIPDNILYSEIDNLYQKLFNSIAINYELDREVIFDSLLNNSYGSLKDIATYWKNNLIKWDTFIFNE